MTWIRVDDDCTNHPKFVRAGGKAGWLWLAGQGYCGRLRTDGLIPKAAAHLLQPGGKPLAAILVREGIWHDEGEHYRVHDYHDYQPSRAQIEERERQTIARVKAWRTRNGYAHGNALHTCVATRVSTHPPVPDPDHEKKERKTGGGADAPSAALLSDLWNEVTTPPIARCRDLTPKRHTDIKARLSERSLEDWREVFTRVQASAFCRGENDRGWVASFDWVIGSPDAAVKVLEGKYDHRALPGVPGHRRETMSDVNARALKELGVTE